MTICSHAQTDSTPWARAAAPIASAPSGDANLPVFPPWMPYSMVTSVDESDG